ncbi:hypothetical protein JCM10212_003099 [Sporobolomyces blumeae]
MTRHSSFSSPPPSSPTASSERPSFAPLSRHHSRSSSQIATLASLALSPSSPASPVLSAHTTSPRSISFGSASRGTSPWSATHDVGSSTGRVGDPADDLWHRDRRQSTDGRQASRRNSYDTSSSSSSDDDVPQSGSTFSPRTDNSVDAGSHAPAAPQLPGSPAHKAATKDRRKTLPALGLPSPLSNLASTGSTPSPGRSPAEGPDFASNLPPTDPLTPAQTSFPSSSTGLAQLIQQKRRQASAPYFASAMSHSRFSPGPGFTVLSGGGTGDSKGWTGGWASASSNGPSSTEASASSSVARDHPGQGSLPPSRNRSRHGSRRSTTSGRLSLQTGGLHLALDSLSPVSIGEEEGMVMTPTTEEWRSLGGRLSELADLRAKDEERLRAKEEERARAREREREREMEREREQAREREEREKASKPIPKRKKNPLKPSLWDVSSDEDDGDDEGDSNGPRLTGALRKFGDGNRGLASSPPMPLVSSPPADSSLSSSPQATRPTYQHVPKSSFSYSSTKGGTAGGFVSHSNTSSLSSFSTPLSSTSPSTAGSPLPTTSKAPDSEPLPAVETFKPTHRPQKSESSVSLTPTNIARPALSRGSLTSATGGLSSPPIVVNPEPQDSTAPPSAAGMPKIPLPPNVYASLAEGLSSPHAGLLSDDEKAQARLEDGAGTPLSTAPTPSIDREIEFDQARGVPLNAPTRLDEIATPSEPPSAPPSPPRDESGAIIAAVDLDWTKPLGPVDPRTYSAVTGLRDISSFVVEPEEAGRGAYGSVKRAREKGPSGRPVGPELIIKYVIKQRILADCWKKHKILGPIPIEVHVLDHLRRVPYMPRPRLRYLEANRTRRETSGRKRPNGGMTRRDSAKQIDLWHGGEDGGTVQTGHPNICGLLDFFEDGEFYYLVMPQATAAASPGTTPTSGPPGQGQDLFDFVDLHPTGLPPAPIARILSQVADALAFLHEHSIVHRDIKDENVVLDPNGNVRLIDFGSAAYVKEGRVFDTFSGTLDFAAPEVLKGARYSGREQDVWALGVLGYVLICGECPFWSPEEAMRGLASDSRALAALQAKLPTPALEIGSPTSESPPPTSDDEDVAMVDAVDLVMRCLETDLKLRPSADAVCDHVFLTGEGGWRGREGWVAVGSSEEDVDA